MKYGDSVTIPIVEMDRKGRGCGEVNGRAGGGTPPAQRRAQGPDIQRAPTPVCAYFCAPGETIRGTFYARKQGVKMLRLDEVTQASPRRIEAPCPHAGRCGGCLWQQFDYAWQLELKRDLINRSLAAGGIEQRVTAVIPCPETQYYRNRMDYCVGPRGELGLKEPGRWNAYLDLGTCLLLSREAVQAMNSFRAYMRETGLAPWNAETQTGYLRYLVIREGKNTGKRMITVVTSEGELPDAYGLVNALAPFASTIYHGINPAITDLSIASRLELLQGDACLEEKIAGRTYRIPPNSFFQTNSLMAEKLLETVAGFLAAERPRTLLDLYCGVGFFGLGLADWADRVVGVELDEQAIFTARDNASVNGIGNAEFAAAKAESLIWEKEAPDAVIVDPPRAGLHPKVVKSLLAHQPRRLVYVSCNYESFVRDFSLLRAAYRIVKMEALDLFPHSPHVELVTSLERI